MNKKLWEKIRDSQYALKLPGPLMMHLCNLATLGSTYRRGRHGLLGPALIATAQTFYLIGEDGENAIGAALSQLSNAIAEEAKRVGDAIPQETAPDEPAAD